MQAYNAATAAMYNEIWGRHAQMFAEAALAYLANEVLLPKNPRAIDLACGTGHLCQIFARAGFNVLGVDLSPAMLAQAEQRCADYVRQGSAQFMYHDIANITNELGTASIITCTYNSINHLPDDKSLRACFTQVARTLRGNGIFIFDINTLAGLANWDRIKVTEHASHTVYSRGFFDGERGVAWKKFSGFRRLDNGYFEKFEQIIFNTAFPVEQVLALLHDVGLGAYHIALLPDIGRSISDPEAHDTVVVVACPTSTTAS